MGNAAGIQTSNRVDTMTVNVNFSPTINIESAGGGGAMTIAGAASGAAIGAFYGGPAGALMGAAIGAAGSLRAQGRSLMPFGESALHRWLSDQELLAIGSQEATCREMSCKVCLRAQVSTSLQPCGHACLCAPCLLSIKQAAHPGPCTCPMCRASVEGCQRVYL